MSVMVGKGGMQRRPRSARTSLLAALVALLSGSVTGSVTRAETLAFVETTVVRPEEGRSIPRVTVLVEDGRIAAVGPRIRIPAGARRIDARGKFLMPGLSDMHVHLMPMDTDDQLFLYLANGVTTVRVMAGTPRALALRMDVADGLRSGPRMVVTGPLLTTLPRPAGFITVVSSVEEIRRRIAEYAAAGYDAIKLHNIEDEAIFLGGIEAAKAAGLRAVGHIPRTLGAARAIDTGFDCIEHFYGYRPEVDPTLAELTVRSGVWNSPTLIVLWTNLHQEDLLREPFPEARYLPAGLSRSALGRRAKAPETIDVAGFQRVLADLDRRGARLLTGTDTGTLLLVPGFSLHREFALWAGAGIAPARILRASTVGAAEWIDGSPIDGRIVKGARADLVLLDADPLVDIAHARRIAGVMAAGRYFDRKDIDARLAAIEARDTRPRTP